MARPQAEAHSTRLMASPFDEALDQDHPAKFVSDVKHKEDFTSPCGLTPLDFARGTDASASLRQHTFNGKSVDLREQNVCGPQGL